MQKIKVVITGGAGFLGRYLCKNLLESGADVISLDRTESKVDGAQNYVADVLDLKSIEKYISQSDVVIHLAALTAHEDIVGDPYRALEISVQGTKNVLDAFIGSAAKQFIFPSTGKIYGKPQYLPYDEQHPLNPSTPLGKSKRITELLIDFYSTNSEKSFSILRIFNVYGPCQKENFLMPTILKQLENQKSLIILGDVQAKRDYIFIDDVVKAFIIVMQNNPKGLNVFNVGTGKSYSAKEIVGTIEKILNRKIEIKVDPARFRKDEFADERADIAKIATMGWKPDFDIFEGLKQTVQAYTEEKCRL